MSTSLPVRRTLPVTTRLAPRIRPASFALVMFSLRTSEGGTTFSVTWNRSSPVSAPVTSSIRPSQNTCMEGAPPMFVNGNTAMRF